MAPSNTNPPDSEIWDDSALVRSWNEAVDEYKKYHSIEARGEDIEKVLQTVGNQSNKPGEGMDYEDGRVELTATEPVNDPHAKNLPEETADPDSKSAEVHGDIRGDAQFAPGQASDRTPPALPQHLIGQVHDEGLKNLLMAWYYAGYYTGLYEGQQQGAGKCAKHEA